VPLIRAPESFTHELPHARFCSLATPSRGASQTSVWRVQLTRSSHEAPAHSLTHEEIFVVLSGTVRFVVAGADQDAHPGDTMVVPRETEISISCLSEQAEMLCCLPVGGQARMGTGELFTPPWAL
jgi:quercetin dioxygenase-like cupin family protein